MLPQDTIVALATPPGSGAIAVIRVSGISAIEVVSELFTSISGKKLINLKSHTVHLGYIEHEGRMLDKVLVTIFKAPNSYTGENTVEISCHGSPYIQQELLQTLLKSGCRMAQPGEFTLRAFLNGKMDLSQAEAVADLIASDSEASHTMAMQQMRGGFSRELSALRQQLLNFASLIELELDFAEEDVEFANREQFKALINQIEKVLKTLIDSFAVGNVLKNGIPVAIVGEPNVGKSTLLNALLNEERAIVSDIAGTTRDTIEDEISLGGIAFRFIDTAGIRKTEDTIEKIGIEKTFQKIEQAQVVVYISPLTPEGGSKAVADAKREIEKIKDQYPKKALLIIFNKKDLLSDAQMAEIKNEIPESIFISAKYGIGINELTDKLLSFVNTGALKSSNTIVTNGRHYEALQKALAEVQKVRFGLETGLSGDLLAVDIRQALYHFGEITGEITSDELLGNIFANFCIGK